MLRVEDSESTHLYKAFAMSDGVSMTPSNKKAWYAQTLESVFLGLVFFANTLFTFLFLAHDGILSKLPLPFAEIANKVIELLNFLFITFFFVSLAFNLIFLKFKNKFIGTFLVSPNSEGSISKVGNYVTLS